MTLTPEGPPNVDVPLEDQTKECLIAYIKSLEKQAERDEKRTAWKKDVIDMDREIANDWDGEGIIFHKGTELKYRISRLDALTPEEKT